MRKESLKQRKGAGTKMIWRILHFIFKFDYIYYETFYNRELITGIARIRKGKGTGKPFIRYIYKLSHHDLGTSRYKKLDELEDFEKDAKKIIWLTCKREKYFPMSEEEWSSKLEEVLEGIK